MSTIVTVRFGDARTVRIVAMGRAARVTDAGFEEADHPRGKGGKFSSGQSVHVVASAHPGNGNVTIHGVHGDRKDAVKHQIETLGAQYKKAKLKHEGSGLTEELNAAKAQHALSQLNQPSARAKSAEVSGSGEGKDLHFVVEGDHNGGVTVHGAHLTPEAAAAHAQKVSREAWSEKGETRSEVTEREWFNAAKAFNANRPAAERVTIEQMENNSHPEFESFLQNLHPMDETLPHPGVAKANKYFVENHLAYGTGFNSGRTGVVRVVHHKG